MKSLADRLMIRILYNQPEFPAIRKKDKDPSGFPPIIVHHGSCGALILINEKALLRHMICTQEKRFFLI